MDSMIYYKSKRNTVWEWKRDQQRRKKRYKEGSGVTYMNKVHDFNV